MTDGSTQQQGLPFQEAEGIVAERSALLTNALRRCHMGVGATAFLRELYDRFRRDADWEISYRDLAEWLGCPQKSGAIRIVTQTVTAGLVIRTTDLNTVGGFAMNRYRLDWNGVLAANRARAIGREGWSPNGPGGGPVRPGGRLMDQVVALEHHPAIPPAAPLMSADLGDPHCSAREPPLGDPPARDTPIQSNPRKKEIYYQPPIQSNPIQPRSDRNGAGGDEPDEPDEPPTIAAVLPDAAAGLVERLAALDDPAQVYGRALRAIYATVPELRESRYVAMEAARLVSDGAVYPQELRRVLLDCRAMRESTGGLRNAAGFFHAKVKIWPGWREPIGTAARARESDKPP